MALEGAHHNFVIQLNIRDPQIAYGAMAPKLCEGIIIIICKSADRSKLGQTEGG
jgi:hypothetical protein